MEFRLQAIVTGNVATLWQRNGRKLDRADRRRNPDRRRRRPREARMSAVILPFVGATARAASTGRVPWGGVGAVGKWPAAARLVAVAAGHLSTAVVIADLR